MSSVEDSMKNQFEKPSEEIKSEVGVVPSPEQEPAAYDMSGHQSPEPSSKRAEEKSSVGFNTFLRQNPISVTPYNMESPFERPPDLLNQMHHDKGNKQYNSSFSLFDNQFAFKSGLKSSSFLFQDFQVIPKDFDPLHNQLGNQASHLNNEENDPTIALRDTLNPLAIGRDILGDSFSVLFQQATGIKAENSEKITQKNGSGTNATGAGTSDLTSTASVVDQQKDDSTKEGKAINQNEEEQEKTWLDQQKVAIVDRCKCTNSKCLKLYCVCFSLGVFCQEGCKCVGCSNKEECDQEVKEARKATLLRNPNAFTSKVEVVSTHKQEDLDSKVGMLGYKKGCKCKKTACKKKYCECYNAGVKCSYLCVCEDCQNREEDPPQKQKPSRRKSSTIEQNGKRKHPPLEITPINNNNEDQESSGDNNGPSESSSQNSSQFTTVKKIKPNKEGIDDMKEGKKNDGKNCHKEPRDCKSSELEEIKSAAALQNNDEEDYQDSFTKQSSDNQSKLFCFDTPTFKQGSKNFDPNSDIYKINHREFTLDS